MFFFRKVVFSDVSTYGRYRVVDMNYNGRKARMLYGDDNSPQSGVALDDDPELLFDYNQRFLEMIESAKPENLLVIGGAAFMLPIAVFERFPEMRIDVVEIDQTLVNIAYQYFYLPHDPRLKIFVEDGKDYLVRSKQKYDMIILDAFSGFTIPSHLLDRRAAELYGSRLSEGGVVAVNFISEYTGQNRRLTHEILDAFCPPFENFELYQADADHPRDDHQNLLFVASDKMIHFDYLRSPSVRDRLVT